MERFDGQEVGVIDDGDDGFAFGVLGAGFGDETCLAFGVVAEGVELERLAEQAQQVGPGVQRAVDDGRDPLLWVVTDDGVFEDGLAGAGFAEHKAESALLAVDLEDVKVVMVVLRRSRGASSRMALKLKVLSARTLRVLSSRKSSLLNSLVAK